MFCVFWGCYQYGGISSPILPWLVTVGCSPSSICRDARPEYRRRIIVSNLAVFYGIYSMYGFPQRVALNLLVALGLISTFCASIYVSMMALYYANVVSSQAELEQEVKLRRATKNNLCEVTEQAERAMLAKSEFLAKMSYELKESSQFDHWIQRDFRSENLGESEGQKCKGSYRPSGKRVIGFWS